MKEPAAKLTAEGLRALVIAAAVIGGGRLVPAEAAAPPDLSILRAEIRAEIRDAYAECREELRDHDRRLLAIERRPHG